MTSGKDLQEVTLAWKGQREPVREKSMASSAGSNAEVLKGEANSLQCLERVTGLRQFRSAP